MAKTDERVDKRRVTMRNSSLNAAGDMVAMKAVDFVRPDFLDAYVADARTRWSFVEVSDEPDAGPGGYEGQTHVPADLSHDLAGQTFAATGKDS